MAGTQAAVTPAGVRAGDPLTLQALCDKRGPAVLAYCERVCAPGEAVAAAADAFARFRAAVAAAHSPAELDPDGLLLAETRHAAAARAPRGRVGSGLARRLGARVAPSACALVPDLLVARAEHRLSEADEQRLGRHLDRCTSCQAASRRFLDAQEAYTDPPRDQVPEPAVHAIVSALAAAVPVAHGAAQAESSPTAGSAADAGAGAQPGGDALAAPEVEPEAHEVELEAHGVEPEAQRGAEADRVLPPELHEVVLTDARGEGSLREDDGPDFSGHDEADLPLEGPAAVAEATIADYELEQHRPDGNGNGAQAAEAAPRAAEASAAAAEPIMVRGHPEAGYPLPEMPARIAPRPGHHPRPRRHEPAHRHGPAWGLLLPAAVLAAALVAVLALAGVFSGAAHRNASVARPTLPAPVAPVRAHHAVSRHPAHRHRTTPTRHRAAARTATTSPVVATVTPTRAATPSPAVSSPVTRAPAVTHSSPPTHSAPRAPTTVQAVGPPSGSAPPSGGAPATGGTGYQPGG
jgi:hypothetical protein